MNCNICPRECNADRCVSRGFCGANDKIKIARAAPHFWEEPCISGTKGSGTVFFSGCNLKCVFCQNEKISLSHYGKEIDEKQLCVLFDKLIEKGVHNLNLVTPTHYADKLAVILRNYHSPVPVVYNTSGYEKVDTLKKLEGLIDIYLPDIKYYDSAVSNKYSHAGDYFETAAKAVSEMKRQTGDIILDSDGTAVKGVLIRHLVLPGNVLQTKKIFDYIADNFGTDTYISLMRQYTPFGKALNMPPIDRKLSAREYMIAKRYVLSLGFENCFFQQKESACDDFVPDFNLEGVDFF